MERQKPRKRTTRERAAKHRKKNANQFKRKEGGVAV